MTAPSSPFVRLTAGGDISTTQSWSCGMAVSAPGSAVTQSQLQALVGAWRAAWESAWSAATVANRLSAYASVDTRLFRYRGYLYPAGGGPAVLQAGEDRTPLAGTGTVPYPTQTAIVATLLSGLPGRSYRGRIYLPLTGIVLQSNHQLTAAQATGIATSVAGIASAVNSFASGGPFGVASIAGLQGRIPISSVRVDTEPDVQRRRADKIVAASFGTANV